MSATDSEVLYEKREAIAFITLNRPQAINAINDAVRTLLPRFVRDADRDPEVRCIVISGAGERGFCAGADIKGFSAPQSPAIARTTRVRQSWIRPFDEASKPTIASIHGHCLGGGFEIALACDLRIASEDARFAFPETGLGLITGIGGATRATRIAGAGLALDLLLTGRRLSAREALDARLVSRVCPAESLQAETLELAQTVAARAPLALAFAKELVRASHDEPFEANLRLESDLLVHLLASEDRAEAGRAFAEKRRPGFKGR